MSEPSSTLSSVFDELGFPADEAENLRIRSILMGELREFIRVHGLSQTEAGACFGVSQPRVSDLVRGHIERFSIDSLVNMAGRAGLTVSVTLEPSP